MPAEPPRPPARDPDRAILGVALLLFLAVLAYSAHRSDYHFTVVAESISGALLVLTFVVLWWRRTRDKPSDGD